MKNQKGITLVALIITIIVMVILAGIIIASAVADGGVIDRAQGAMREHERAEIEDLIIASYVYKTTASTNTIALLDLGKTGTAIFENLTTNGFVLKDSNGNEFENSEDFVAEQEDDKIDINVEGKHGEYEGTVKEDGVDGKIEIKDEEIIEDTTPPIPPVPPEEPEEESFTFKISDLKNDSEMPQTIEEMESPGYMKRDGEGGCSAYIVLPKELSTEFRTGKPKTIRGDTIYTFTATCSDPEFKDEFDRIFAGEVIEDGSKCYYFFADYRFSQAVDDVCTVICFNAAIAPDKTLTEYREYFNDLTFTITK